MNSRTSSSTSHMASHKQMEDTSQRRHNYDVIRAMEVLICTGVGLHHAHVTYVRVREQQMVVHLNRRKTNKKYTTKKQGNHRTCLYSRVENMLLLLRSLRHYLWAQSQCRMLLHRPRSEERAKRSELQLRLHLTCLKGQEGSSVSHINNVIVSKATVQEVSGRWRGKYDRFPERVMSCQTE